MGGGASREMMTKVCNGIISQSLMQSTVTCRTNIVVDQDINLSCDGFTGGSNPFPHEANSACISCYESALDMQEKQHEMIKATWNTAKGHAPMPVSYEQEVVNLFGYLNATCLERCKACTFSNFSQSQMFKWDVSCKDYTDVATKFKSVAKGNLEQSLNNNQGVLDSLMKSLGPSSKQDTLTMINNRISSRVNHTFISDMMTEVNAQQSINLNGGQHTGLTQQGALTGVSDFVAKQRVSDTILNESEWAMQQKIYNDQNTVGSLGDIVKDTALSVGDALSGVLGKVMVAVIVAIVVVVLALGIAGIVNSVK